MSVLVKRREEVKMNIIIVVFAYAPAKGPLMQQM